MNINATLISQALIFAVFVYICYRYIWPPILSTMEERENKMAAGLEAAKQADDSLEEAKLTYEKELKEAKKEAANIVEKANNRSSQILNDAKVKAEAEAEKIIESGSKKLESEANKTREELKQQLSSIVVETASKIIDEEIDEKKHENIIKKAAEET